MKAQLVAYLLADAGLLARVGPRIEWDVLPQGGPLTAIALYLVSAPREYTMAGRIGLTGFLVQMDVWAPTLAARETASAALIAALDGLRGGDFQGAFIEGQRDSYTPGDGPDSTGSSSFFLASLDVRVWFNEA
jgi:hypothetical protein